MGGRVPSVGTPGGSRPVVVGVLLGADGVGTEAASSTGRLPHAVIRQITAIAQHSRLTRPECFLSQSRSGAICELHVDGQTGFE